MRNSQTSHSGELIINPISNPPPSAAMLTDVMTLENPVNGSSPSVGTDYPGHKAKGETCPLQRAKFSLMAVCKR